MTNNQIKTNLIDFYNHHAQERDGYTVEPWKAEARGNFLSLIKRENKKSLLEIGAGPGKDSKFFEQNGLDVTCIDLSPEMIKLCLQKGLTAHIMDVNDLKFPPNSFNAVYVLNSFLHISETEVIATLENVKRVLKPAGLFYLGVYGGQESEGI